MLCKRIKQPEPEPKPNKKTKKKIDRINEI